MTARSEIAPGLIMVIDTSEPPHTAYDFSTLCPSVRESLTWGDYSLVGHTTQFTCERKQIDDLFATLFSSERRARFLNELAGMRSYEYAAIIIEATKREVRNYRPSKEAQDHGAWGGLSEAAKDGRCRGAINSLHSFEIEYGVRVHYVDRDRRYCMATVYQLAARFHRMKHPEEKSPKKPRGTRGGAGSRAEPA